MARTAELLYATNNPGKLDEVGKYLEGIIELKSPKDFSIDLDVEETGTTLEENALLKAQAYREVAPPESIVMTDDTGLEIDALDGEPGVHVRRWKDGQTRMTDEEIIDYCLKRMKAVPAGKRGAQFRTVIALALSDGSTELFDGTLRGEIAEKPLDIKPEGFPFRGLMYVPEAECYLGELERSPRSVLTHRQKAVRKAVDWLKGYNR